MFKFKPEAVIATLFLLAGCGGSGSDSSSVPPEVNTPPFDLVPIQPSEARYERQQVLQVAVSKNKAFALEHNPTRGYPISDNGVSHNWGQSSIRWSSGFYPGILWQLTQFDDDSELLAQSKRWTLPLQPHAQWNGHDVGFLIDYSFGKAARSTLSDEYDETLKQAADNLLSRYDADVGAIRSWDNDSDFLVIIDNMMNLSLLFNASRQFNDDRYYNAALAHMQTTAREFVRSDGGSYHVVHFDENTGAVKRKRTQQGFSDSSTWARGQAWGIYGFALAYKETGDALALQTAKTMANYYLNKLPADNVPYWDFSATGDGEPRDTSAATIAAAGIWMLSKQVSGEDGETYKQASLTLIDALLNDEYLVMDENKSVLLKHATGNKPGNFEVDVSLIYADYYLLETLLMQEEILEWPL